MTYNFENINEDPLEFIKNNKKKDIINLLIAADEAFFNSDKTILDDDIYDIIKDYIRKKYPRDPYLKRVGADIDNKVILPYYMGSQNKIKDSNEEITKYKKKYKGPYMISDKLDGVSCLAVYKKISSDNKYDIKLYTRGNGKEGQDISHLLEYINGFPNTNNIKSNYLAVRGELIISKKNWENLKLKGEQGVNPRNTLSGAINSKTLNKNLLNTIDFVCYTIIEFDTESNTNAKQDNFDILKSKGFLIVNYEIVDDINLNILSESLQKARNNNYIIDGIVISDISKT
jgi:NAD-dependent DNA ligase